MNPFDFVNSVNVSKENVIERNPECEKDYIPYLINKAMSYFPDTVFYSQQMNENSHIDKKLQYEYFLNSVSKKPRFSKWAKVEKQEILECIKRRYHYSDTKAREAIKCLTEDQIKEILAAEMTADGNYEMA